MQSCLGIYIESNLIKYAKVSKEKNEYKVEAHDVIFYDDLNETLKKIIDETFSFNIPISVNLANEKYLYFDIFALLSKADVQKTIQTEYEAFCDENKYNQKAFETRYALVPNIENKEKIKAIQVIVNKIELNRQKQFLEKYHLSKVIPIGTAIASVAKIDKKDNVLIVNMEDKTTITTIYNGQIYDVETLEIGSQEILEKINRVENSMSKAYEICKGTTIYTSSVMDDTKEQPYLEYIVPTLYQVSQRIQEIVTNSPAKIATVYLTGTLSVVNNIDLYFQEFLPTTECKILKPSIVEETVSQLNIKEYIEVNSAIALAMQALGEGVQALNFKQVSLKERATQLLSVNIGEGKKENKESNKKTKININFSFKGALDKTERMLVRAGVALILINIIFAVFSKMLYGQMNDKQLEVQGLITSQQTEISKIKEDTNSLDKKDTKYRSLTEDLKAINNKISNIARKKNLIPNLLNQIMHIIPDKVQLITIQNTTEIVKNSETNENEELNKISIVARAKDYDDLGYFIARLKVEQFLENVVSSSSQKNGEYVVVTIEGELP